MEIRRLKLDLAPWPPHNLYAIASTKTADHTAVWSHVIIVAWVQSLFSRPLDCASNEPKVLQIEKLNELELLKRRSQSEENQGLQIGSLNFKVTLENSKENDNNGSIKIAEQ